MTVKPYYADEAVTLHHGDCVEVLRSLPDASVDAVVTDPPYGLEFMGKDWGSFKTYAGGNPNMKPQGAQIRATDEGEWQPGRAYGARGKTPRCRRCGKLQRGNGCCKCPSPQWDTRTAEGAFQYQAWCEDWAREAWRVLKPGGHLLAFGGTRTVHRLTCAVEDAGFEIRDGIDWIYGSGFPKSLNLGDGRGTALKPAREPIVVARKPLAGTVAANVQAYGTGVLNIDACRTPAGQDYHDKCASVVGFDSNRNGDAYGEWTGVREDSAHPDGRWPTNVVFGHDCHGRCLPGCPVGGLGELGRFFPVFRYEAKAPTAERTRTADGTAHPTVKPLDLMRWLVRLVTPPGGTVLDLFAGSGTTGEACVLEGFRCIAIEREAAYLPLITARLTKALQPALDFGAVA